jgi:hypothetical protein
MSRCSSAKVFGGSGMPSGVCTVARRSAALRRVGLKLRMPSRAEEDAKRPNREFEEGERALSAWLDATRDPETTPGPSIFEALEDASKRLVEDRKTGRDKILQDIPLQRIPAETARSGLELLGWADGAFYHAWRLAESLRIASGKQPAG